jgi:hypothetical protein
VAHLVVQAGNGGYVLWRMQEGVNGEALGLFSC